MLRYLTVLAEKFSLGGMGAPSASLDLSMLKAAKMDATAIKTLDTKWQDSSWCVQR